MRLPDVIALAAVAVAAGCGPDSTPFHASLEFERGLTQECSSDVCSNIPMSCAAQVLVRIVDAKNPNLSYFSECTFLEGDTDLCALSQVDLGDRPIPNTMVRIEFAIWPYVEGTDPEVCPTVKFDKHGRAEQVFDGENPTPAIAGASYFPVGSSEEAKIVLGCVDEQDLDAPACRASDFVIVGAGVLDFDTNLSVSPTVQNLEVSVGEPKLEGATWSMQTEDTVVLERRVIAGVPVWEGPEALGGVDLEFEAAACIQVFEDGATGVTNTLACRPASATDLSLDLTGVLVRKATQDLVQDALGGSFPPDGMVLGRVLDETGQPAEGVTIIPSTAGTTVIYLSDDMATTTLGAVTTTSGAFVSLNAPFDTTWAVENEDVVEEQLGGQVTGKVTVIELQLMGP